MFAGEVVIVLAILVLARRIPEGPREKGGHLDLVGTALSALGLGLIVFGVLRSGVWGFVDRDASIGPGVAARRRAVLAGQLCKPDSRTSPNETGMYFE